MTTVYSALWPTLCVIVFFLMNFSILSVAYCFYSLKKSKNRSRAIGQVLYYSKPQIFIIYSLINNGFFMWSLFWRERGARRTPGFWNSKSRHVNLGFRKFQKKFIIKNRNVFVRISPRFRILTINICFSNCCRCCSCQ